jgi:hypothetical protein
VVFGKWAGQPFPLPEDAAHPGAEYIIMRDSVDVLAVLGSVNDPSKTA